MGTRILSLAQERAYHFKQMKAKACGYRARFCRHAFVVMVLVQLIASDCAAPKIIVTEQEPDGNGSRTSYHTVKGSAQDDMRKQLDKVHKMGD